MLSQGEHLLTAQADTGLPECWEVRHSNSKNLPYYFNSKTHESRWEPPEEADTDKLKVYMAQHHSSKATGMDEKADEGKVRAAHLLVKHRESRRPSSWKEQNITRSKDEAIQILKGYEERIKSGSVSLGDLAVSESDCSSARKRGDLGFFGKGQMQKEFEDASFALQPGQISGVVQTASGVHLIERYVTNPLARICAHQIPASSDFDNKAASACKISLKATNDALFGCM